MIILNIGPLSSASTWVGNIVAQIVQRGDPGREYIRSYADSLALLKRMPQTNRCNITMKSHHPGKELGLLAKSGAAKVIMTMRDPRDCVASLMQRFERPFDQSCRDIESSLAHIDEIWSSDVLRLRYESRFMDKVETIEQIATYLDVPLGRELIQNLHKRFSFSEVKKYIETIPSLPASERNLDGGNISDRRTGFFANHMTDGLTGKYARVLDETQKCVVNDRFGYYLARFGYAAATEGNLRAACFYYNIETVQHDGNAIIDIQRDQKGCLVYGPYLNLPSGRWALEFRANSNNSTSYLFDVAANAERIGHLQGPVCPGRNKLEFLNTDPANLLEFRIFAGPAAQSDRLTFSGVNLSRL